ncbi:ATP-dependent helicase [Methyloligella sp. 2.7D]|uniref:ATP-dependent helicase n=1 Tax=unclassified Methyloligella TaxID=2625955 RepID=UPI00157C63E6|nr:ATP-dependent helicase [Methyloligella sp. GL2]QKP77631.1 ATP-dependent helicase [Methyloligella sp. GL2]
MTATAFNPTSEQAAIIGRDGHAFVRACPGAGKTRTMVERARALLADQAGHRSVAFLSFTNAAVDELTARLAMFGALPTPIFPNFIGTFDRFLWQFFIVPFGVDGCSAAPRLVPDKKDWVVKPPYNKARALTLDYFNRQTGALIKSKANDIGFKPKNGPGAWETIARNIIARSVQEGRVDFDDVRAVVRKRLADKTFADRVGAALAARFREIVVDEAQDCNPADLDIIAWLRRSGLTIKIICDPNQGIYGFRGGVTGELEAFADTFDQVDHLPMSGNFRSSPAICAAISQLRPPSSRGTPDKALGRYKSETTPVYLLSYGGQGVSPQIGSAFQALAMNLKLRPNEAQILAATWASASNAAGRRAVDVRNNKTLLLAQSIMRFLNAFEAGNRREALGRLHRAVLTIRGHIANLGDYGNYITELEVEGSDWRPDIITLGQALEPKSGEAADQWLKRARTLLDKDLVGTSTINRRLRNHASLASLLSTERATDLPARSIHDVKGLEFPAICVVLSPQTSGQIIGVLTGANTAQEDVENARKIYVAASRAERLLAIATPKSRVTDLKTILNAGGGAVVVSEV